MASITPSGKGYRAFVHVRGVRDSATFRTRREAVSWAAARETELRNTSAKLPAALHTLRNAMDRYADEVSPTKRGERWERVRLAMFGRDPIAGLTLDQVTAEQLALWRDRRLAAVSAGSVLREMTLMRSVLEQCRREWLWISDNPLTDVRRPREPDHREVLIHWRQIRLMLRTLGHGGPVRTVSQAVAVAFLLALRTGMRAGEICGLEWPRVHADHVVLPVTKTTPRSVPLSRQAVRTIDRMRGWDGVSVFNLTPATLDALFRKTRSRAGLTGFTFHDSRHVAATMLARRIDVLDLCKSFGWSNPKMAMRYYNPTASDIAARINSRTTAGRSR